MRRFAIINPAAGNGKTGAMLSRILTMLDGVIDGYVVSEFPGHCREIASRQRSVEMFIAVGGDGTVSEIVNGMDVTRQRLGIMPTGTGNSLARDIGIRKPEDTLRVVNAAVTTPIDLVRFNYTAADGASGIQYCTSTASIGYAARVTEIANDRLKKLGKFCYPAASLFCALGIKPIQMQISIDGRPAATFERTGIIFQNVRFAANFELFPEASSNDGLINAMETDAGCIGQTLHNISVLSRLRFYRPAASWSATQVGIQFANPQQLMIDGEIIQKIRMVNAAVEPGMLRCCR